jgi:hypothetical protein
MAFQMNLAKENNHMYMDVSAYWCIEDVVMDTSVSYTEDGKDTQTVVSFVLRAYPSRAAKMKTGVPVATSLGFGGPASIAVNSALYEWRAVFKVEDVFSGDVPATLNGQLAVLYPFVKNYLGINDAIDVIEE